MVKPGDATSRTESSMSPVIPDRLDIAIVGGGLVGASLALALRGSGLQVGVIEAFTPSAPDHPGYDDRTLVLNPVSCNILEQLGIGAALQQYGVPIQTIHVSDRGRFGRAVLHARQHGLEWFGRVIEAWRLGQALLQQVQQDQQLHWLSPLRLEQLQLCEDSIRLQFENAGQAITTRLLVGADGADSRVRELLALPARRHDYQQTAIICNATPSRAHAGTAYERFTETGPLALLPQARQRVGVVWTVTSQQADALLAADNAAFLAGLQHRFGYRLGHFQRVGKRASYPLQLVRAERNTAHRSVLIGNASHTIHPISAQGFNLGLRDAAALAGHVSGATDPGQAALLEAYQQQRQSDQDDTIRYTDNLARLYSNTSSTGRLLRSAGLLAHQWLPALQRRLVLNAMGYRDAVLSGKDHVH